MSTFSQWFNSKSRIEHEPKRVTWVCGSERTLVNEVADTIVSDMQDADYVRLEAGTFTKLELEAELKSVPVVSGTKLIEIASAEKLSPVSEFVNTAKKNSNRDTKVLFISNEDSAPEVDGKTIHALKGSTVVNTIECNQFTEATASVAVEWVRSKVDASQQVAGVLLERAAGDPRVVRDACAKLASLGRTVKIADVNDILRQKPRDTFTNSLLALDKKTAYLAISEIPEKDYSKVLAMLDSQLDFAHKIHTMEVGRATPSEIVKAAGSRRFLLSELQGVTKFYNRKRVDSIRNGIATLDMYVRKNKKKGTLEALVALW